MFEDHRIERDWFCDGLRCVVVMGTLGHRCGYVGITKEHPLFKVEYSELYNMGIHINVHGGLTYSDMQDDYPVKSTDTWWFGYDCGHAGDGHDPEAILPEYRSTFVSQPGEILRSQEFCIEECKSLVKQLLDWRTENYVLQPYQHDCDQCQWVGWFSIHESIPPANVYVCPDQRQHSDRHKVVIRFSDEPSDYWSSSVNRSKGPIGFADAKMAFKTRMLVEARRHRFEE